MILILIIIISLAIYFCNQKKLIIKKKLFNTNHIHLGTVKSIFFETSVIIKKLSKIGITNEEITKTKIASDNNLAPKVYSNENKNILVTEHLDENKGWYLLFNYEKKNGKSKKLNNLICSAINKLNKINIVHNDLQEINILYNPSRKKIYFIDFENSKFINETNINNKKNEFYMKRCEI